MKERIKLMEALVGQLTEGPLKNLADPGPITHAEGAGLRQVQMLLSEIDPGQALG